VVSSLSRAERPDSVGAFVQEFARLAKEDVFSPFIELGFWDPVSTEDQTAYMSGVRQIFWGNYYKKMARIMKPANIRPTSLQEYGGLEQLAGNIPLGMYEEGTMKLVPEPTHVLEVQAHYDSETSIFYWFPIGAHEGKYYFCTAVPIAAPGSGDKPASGEE
jgi:hypothetical protein